MNIDAPYEFAKFVNSEGVNLTPDPGFCVLDEDHCAILYSPPSCVSCYPYYFFVKDELCTFSLIFIDLHVHCAMCLIVWLSDQCKQQQCPTVLSAWIPKLLFSGSQDKAEDVSRIHYAIKSCEKYHSERLPVLHNTWLKHATNYAIYSDVKGMSLIESLQFSCSVRNCNGQYYILFSICYLSLTEHENMKRSELGRQKIPCCFTDSSYGTVSLGVPNTERGHCGKTLAIIRHTAQLDGMQWLVIADDDTLIR